MANFYLDNDVSLRLVPFLESHGHVVSTARDVGRTGAGDEAQLLTAVERQSILVTHNRRDFDLLHDAWRLWPPSLNVVFPAHPGILALAHAPVAEQLAAIDFLLEKQTTRALQNELFVWRRAGGWERRIVA